MKKYNGKELYKGLLFIKSMMSMNNVNRQKELDQTLFGIESREKHENEDLSVLEDKLQMLKPNDREYAMSTCLIFIEGLEARKEVL